MQARRNKLFIYDVYYIVPICCLVFIIAPNIINLYKNAHIITLKQKKKNEIKKS